MVPCLINSLSAAQKSDAQKILFWEGGVNGKFALEMASGFNPKLRICVWNVVSSGKSKKRHYGKQHAIWEPSQLLPQRYPSG